MYNGPCVWLKLSEQYNPFFTLYNHNALHTLFNTSKSTLKGVHEQKTYEQTSNMNSSQRNCNRDCCYISLQLVFYHVARSQNMQLNTDYYEVKGDRGTRDLQMQMRSSLLISQKQPFYVQTLPCKKKKVDAECFLPNVRTRKLRPPFIR